MNRVTLLVAVVAALLLGLVSRAQAEPDGIIRITSERVSLHYLGGGWTHEAFVLKNYALTPDNIGHAHALCVKIGRVTGPAPPDARQCDVEYVIGRHALQVQGVARRRLFYTLTIIGGQGPYDGHGGSLVAVRYANNPVRERLVFRLTK